MSTMSSEPEQHPSIVLCPACGASVSLPVIPPSDSTFFCDICSSPHLLLSTNDGVDWNPLSSAFNSLSIGNEGHTIPAGFDATAGSTTAGAELNETMESSAGPSNAAVDVQDASIDQIPSIADEMKRRSLILSELMSFREILQQQHGIHGTSDGQEEGFHGDINAPIAGHETEMEMEDDGMDQMQRTFQEMLNLRGRGGGGIFLMDEVDTSGFQQGQGGEGGYPTNMISNDVVLGHHPALLHPEEEGMFDDPPLEYVTANPPIRDSSSGGGVTMIGYQQVEGGGGGHEGSGGDKGYTNGFAPAQSHIQQQSGQHQQSGGDDFLDFDDDDDEGQIYATPEQRDEMRARRRELRMDKDLREREMVSRRYGIGGLGVKGAG